MKYDPNLDSRDIPEDVKEAARNLAAYADAQKWGPGWAIYGIGSVPHHEPCNDIFTLVELLGFSSWGERKFPLTVPAKFSKSALIEAFKEWVRGFGDTKPIEAFELAKREAENWECAAKQWLRDVEYYRGILDQIALMLGDEAFTADDGKLTSSPLRAKIGEIIAARLLRLRDLEGIYSHDSAGDVCELPTETL